jgi:sRNA-binding protein
MVAARRWLYRTFIKTFGPDAKPIAIDIDKDILLFLRSTIAPSSMKAALRSFVGSLDYLRNVAAPGAMRIDIFGDPVERVSDRDHAERRLAERHKPAKPAPVSGDAVASKGRAS